MQAAPHSIYAIASPRALLQLELDALAPLLAGIYGQHGLYVGPPAIEFALPAHLLGHLSRVQLAHADRLVGDLCCTPAQLPFGNDSFKLIVLQHALESLVEPSPFCAELARVLAPEGVALILGFNPYGGWRPWLAWQQRQRPSLQLQSPLRWASCLARHDIDVMQTRYLGTFLPGMQAPLPKDAKPARWLRGFDRGRAAYLLLARKRRSTLTPLRLRKSLRETPMPAPYLAPSARQARP